MIRNVLRKQRVVSDWGKTVESEYQNKSVKRVYASERRERASVQASEVRTTSLGRRTVQHHEHRSGVITCTTLTHLALTLRLPLIRQRKAIHP
jgi:hypothetical protein